MSVLARKTDQYFSFYEQLNFHAQFSFTTSGPEKHYNKSFREKQEKVKTLRL